ncbi:MAG: hypothetical protein K2N85_12700, partial [Lachnospiraceae bacterium]|nr:hypothetical protein [Lachnospiraceae bacterium]
TDESIVNETAETVTDEPVINETAENNSDASNKTPTNLTEAQKAALNSQGLYGQFLSGDIPVTFNSNYTENIYLEPILENGNSYTLTELGECVSKYYLDSEYTGKKSYDYIQYAYVGCPDSADVNDKNLLVKFVGLSIYSPGDDSYAVFIITDDNGQLYVTDAYECWARSETTAYANGVLGSWGSNGANDHSYTLSVILSNGQQTTIYDGNILTSDRAGSVGGSIYWDIFKENTYPNLAVYIFTIGDEKLYQYDTSYCSEEEKPLCETYISRCHDEAGINWVTDEELESAIQRQCSALGIDYSITQEREEAVWNDLW